MRSATFIIIFCGSLIWKLLYADLLAEKTLLAEQNNRTIVVEIKSFINPSPMRDFELALG